MEKTFSQSVQAVIVCYNSVLEKTEHVFLVQVVFKINRACGNTAKQNILIRSSLLWPSAVIFEVLAGE